MKPNPSYIPAKYEFAGIGDRNFLARQIRYARKHHGKVSFQVETSPDGQLLRFLIKAREITPTINMTIEEFKSIYWNGESK